MAACGSAAGVTAVGGTVTEARQATFCEQKVAKNFANLGRAGFKTTGPKPKKFLRRFF
jgi:hypothetical protein